MSKKEKFIEDVENLIEQLSEEGKEYFETLKNAKDKSEITEKGKIILTYMQNHTESLKAKDIATAINSTGRSVSGSIKKLVADGYVEKTGMNPTTYAITEIGLNYKLD